MNNDEENKSNNEEEEQTNVDEEPVDVETGSTNAGDDEPTNVEGEPTTVEDRSTNVQEEKPPEGSRPTTPEPGGKSKKSGVSALLGGIVGGLISAVAVILLFTSGAIDLNDSAETSSETPNSSDNESTEVVNTLSTDNADTASNMEEASKAVVGVTNLQQQNIWEEEGNEAGTGSGIIYKKEDGNAYVVTNNHVIQDAEEVEVRMHDDEQVPAEVLGTDPLTDLAVLEIDGEKDRKSVV